MVNKEVEGRSEILLLIYQTKLRHMSDDRNVNLLDNWITWYWFNFNKWHSLLLSY
jgi:hypothetical protein